MTSIRTSGARFGLALLGVGLALGSAAAGAAQPGSNAGGNVESQIDDPLSRNLKAIAENPRDEAALMGAGKAALDLGDARAALIFFGRAEEIMPGDGWIKLGMASALVQLEQPAAALKFFRDAMTLGVPEAEIARDRGLAYDISGDPRRAQRDYRLALSRRADPEVTRRLALSLAISGDRAAALQLLEDPLQLRSRAAARTRALVLALTGDTEGAARLVEAAMPGPQSAAILPYLARLPALGARDKALAVHLGQFPQAGNAAPVYAQSQALPPAYRPIPPPADEASDEPDETPPPVTPPVARPSTPARVAAAVRTVPIHRAPAPATAAAIPIRPVPVRTASRQEYRPEPPMSLRAWAEDDLPPMPRRPPARASERIATRQAPVLPPALGPRPMSVSAPASAPAPASVPAERSGTERIASFQLPPLAARGVPRRPAAPILAPAPPPAAGRLAEVAATLAQLDREQAPRARIAEAVPSRPATQRGRTALAAAVDRAARSARPRAPAAPSRHWVQIAHGGDKSSLPIVLARLREKAPKLLDGRDAWTASADSTNKLLLGPFSSDRAAQSFVDRLTEADLTAFAWTSDDGQSVERLSAK